MIPKNSLMPQTPVARANQLQQQPSGTTRCPPSPRLHLDSWVSLEINFQIKRKAFNDRK